MVAYTRYAFKQREYRLSSLSRKYSECVYTGKKYEPVEPVVNFKGINKALERLEKEEIEAEAT